jgi:hypothetical protein
MDSNLYVLEIYDGTILYLNEPTRLRDGWFWGTDDKIEDGPFASPLIAVEAARRHVDRPLNLIIWNAENFATANEPSPSGNIIVVDTAGCFWLTEQEAEGDSH